LAINTHHLKIPCRNYVEEVIQKIRVI